MEKNTESIVAEIKALLSELRAKGIPEETIEGLISDPGRGRIQLKTNGALYLPDYGGVSVRLNPMERTLSCIIHSRHTLSSQ